MAEALNRPIVARRNTPFARVFPFTDTETDEPVDFTGATVAMQVRQYGAQPGDALIDLAEVGAELTEGLLVEEGQITVFIDRGSLADLPGGKPGASVIFEYDLKVRLAGRVEEVWAEGSFTVKPGVTDRRFIRSTEASARRVTEDGRIRVEE